MFQETVAVTGGTGFVGGMLIDYLIAKGYLVKVLARSPGKLGSRAIEVSIIEGDLGNEAALNELAMGANYFVHCAGVTLARDDADYGRINVVGAQNAARAAAHAGARLVHISSMSAQLPHVSAYAKSKFDSERAVLDRSGNNEIVILRGPAIYGPGDPVTLPYFKLVKAGIAAEPATIQVARASILYVEDMASAIVTAFTQGESRMVYEVDDGLLNGHEWRQIGETLSEVFGRKTRRVRVSRPILEAYHGVARAYAKATGNIPSVRTGQLNEFFHDDWTAKENIFSDATAWHPVNSLRDGFAKTVSWYQEQGWLKT